MTRTNLSGEELRAHTKQWLEQAKQWVMAARPRPWQMAYHPTTYWTCENWRNDR